MTFTQQLTDYINACFTGLWIKTWEPDEAERQITKLATEKNWQIIRWDIAKGWGPPNATGTDPNDPMVPLNIITQTSTPATDQTTILILNNYHRFLSNPIVMQKTFNTLAEGKLRRLIMVVLAPTVQIPQELEKVFVVLEHQLPDKSTLRTIAEELDDCVRPETITDQLLAAAAGLTHYEAEGAFALSLTRHKTLNTQTVWELKEGMLKKSGVLTMHRGTETLTELGGLHAIKAFARRAITTRSTTARARGLLMLGIPGTGKSAFAKALGNDTGRPTIILDVGALMGSLVGQSEENARKALHIADAMAPCVLFVDEIEKAFAGAGADYVGDSGVGNRLFGTILTWLNDHTSEVFFVATCNDVSKLPPEFSRAERFDATFFLDLPTKDEKDIIWSMYRDAFNAKGDTPNDDQWTGAEIKACCRISSLLDVTLAEASENIIPIAKTSSNKISALREWANGRCLSASTPGIYRSTQSTPEQKTRRKLSLN